LLRCGVCQQNMKAVHMFTVDRYVCARWPRTKSCAKVATPRSLTEAYVVDRLFDFLSQDQIQLTSQRDRSLAQVDADLADTECRIKRLVEAHYMDGRLPEVMFGQLYEQLNAQLDSLRFEQRHAEGEVALRANALRPRKREDLEIWWATSTRADQRAALRTAIARIRLMPPMSMDEPGFDAGRVRIDWSYEVYAYDKRSSRS